MLLLATANSSSASQHVVAIFGVGLIGGAVKSALHMNTDFSEESLPFTWFTPDQHVAELESVAKALSARHADLQRFSILWSAGKGGFASSVKELEVEFQSFVNVLNFAEKLSQSHPNALVDFHLVSSAGGLFEGKSLVSRDTEPAPLRPYGTLKLRQENALYASSARLFKLVYRPSSVYGFAHEGKRAGLISVILQSGIQHRVLSLVGNQNTLRDFVFSRDIGQFIAAQILEIPKSNEAICHTLASGRPTSIHEIQEIAERVLRRKVYFVFSDSNRNAADITYSKHLLPTHWAPIDIATGIRLVHQNMQRLA
ncbi:MAG: NAD-dependent epimerase/dehydratase family protein [bacterium]|nr:NAD-dependent epimerase/dehydratase family protein [bacterium]